LKLTGNLTAPDAVSTTFFVVVLLVAGFFA